MNKRLITLIALTVSLIGYFTAFPAESATTATAVASIRITRGDLSIRASNIQFNTVNLDTGVNIATGTNMLTITDATGTGAGWHVTAKADNLVSTDGKNVIPLSKANFSMKGITPDQISTKSRKPLPEGTDTIRFNGSEQRILAADRDEGMGRFFVNPTYEMTVPMDSPVGDYTSKVTYSIYTGP